ncbi:MAG: alpha/beta hydrolase [Actinomycetes bacterium]
MRPSSTVLLLDAVRRRTSVPVTEMGPAQLAAARSSFAPRVPLLGPLLTPVVQRLFGAPHPDVDVHDTTVPGAAGELGLRVSVPRAGGGARPLVVHLHGGGFVTGSPAQYDWWCTNLAAGADVLVASVDYRKAPEHVAPAAARDAVAAATWLAGNASRFGGVDGAPVAVAGDSAGGNLAALVALAARDAGGVPEVAAQVLVYPATDLTRSFASHRRLADAPILPKASIDAFTALYVEPSPVPADDPSVSPWFAGDLGGLPPALVQTAEQDPLVDEGEAYARRMEAEGTTVRLTRYVGQPHGFVSLPGVCPPAHQALAEAVQFLDTHLPRPA